MTHHAGQISLALLTTLLASGCSEPKYVIEPGAVTSANTGIPISDIVGGKQDVRVLSSSFMIKPSTAIGAIESDLIGGGCLIADLNHLNIPDKAVLGNAGGSCSTDAQCDGAIPQAQKAKGFQGYCVTERKQTATKDAIIPAKRVCWTRPGPPPAYCNLDKVNARKADQSYPIPATANAARPYPLNSDGVRWRVRTCLNGKGDTAAARPCSGDPGEKLVVDGPVFQYPVSPKYTPPPEVKPPVELPKKPGG